MQGHQLGKLLVQNLWKVVGAFGLGVVAVVGGGLILSDVHRIPQAKPSSATVTGDLSEKSDTGNPTGLRDAKQAIAQEANGATLDSQTAGQDNAKRLARRKHPRPSTIAEVPSEKSQPSIPPPPLPAGSDTIAQVLPGPAAAQLTSAPPPSADAVLRLAADTPVTVRLTQEVSSKDNRKGEMFKGVLAVPLTAHGVVVAQSGAPVMGRIVDARSARLFRGGSNLNLELTQVEAVNGRPLKLKTTQWYETGSHSRVVTAAILPSEAARKVSGAISGAKDGAGEDPNRPERTVQPQSADNNDKAEKKKSAVILPSGSEIVFRLVEPITVTDTVDRH